MLLWDYAHANKRKHSKFQKLWIEPYKIASILRNNYYLLQDDYNRHLSYPTNKSHIKHFTNPAKGSVQVCSFRVFAFLFLVLFLFALFPFVCFVLLFVCTFPECDLRNV